jgi:hypothetical protein
MPQPWERQEDETQRAFECFTAYLEAGSDRDLCSVYRQTTGKAQAKQASGSWNGWHKRWSWQERAQAYDDRLAKERQSQREKIAGEQFEKDLENYRKIHQQSGTAGLQIVAQLKEKARQFMNSDQMQISNLEDLDRVSRIIRALETPSSEALAQALGIKDLLRIKNASD